MTNQNSDTLISVRIIPRYENIDIQESDVLEVVFNPVNYPYKKGKWVYDSEFISSDTPDITSTTFSFTALKQGSTKVTYIPDTNPLLSGVCYVNINTTPLEKITLSPKNEVVSFGDTFDVNVTYTPNDAPHVGEWTYDHSVLKLINDDMDVGTFEVISSTQQTTLISFSYNDIKDTNQCHISSTEATEVLLSPSSEIVSEDEDFYIDITYVPSNAEKNGIWNYDQTKVTLINDTDSTVRAHFKAIEETPPEGIDLTYFVSGNVSAKNTCHIQKLKSISLSPGTEEVKKGDYFTINVEYDPPGTYPLGTWLFDATKLRIVDKSNAGQYVRFFVLDETPTPLQISYSTLNRIGYNTCKIDSSTPPSSVSLSPKTESVYVGDTFKIDVNYTPDYSIHGGIWIYDKETFELSDSSTDECGVFTVLKYNTDPMTITFISNTSASVNDSNICRISPYKPLDSIKLSPQTQAVTVSSTFAINIDYIPDTAAHSGTWVYDSNYIQKEDISTPDVGYFTALKESDQFQQITYNSEGKSADAYCLIKAQPSPTAVAVTPKTLSKDLYQEFNVIATFTPSDANPAGRWVFDETLVERLDDGSIINKAKFRTLKSTGDTTTPITYITLNSKVDACILTINNR